MKKLLSLVLAMVLTLALAVPAAAVEAKPAASREVGVILNGKPLTFPADAKPELKNGSTMVPVKLLVEAMGGKVSVEHGEIICKFDADKDFTQTKEARFRLSETYFKGDYTFVALRDIASARGFDLFWDSKAQSAVLVERDALIAEIDKSFTVLNAALAKLQNDPEKNYKTTATYDIILDIPDTDTQSTVKLTLKMKLDMISSATAAEMTVSLDASALTEFLELEDAVKRGEMAREEATAIQAVLKDLTLSMRFDLKTMTYYMNIPVLSVLSDGQVSASTWVKMEMADMMDLLGMGSALDLLTLSDKEVPTVGAMLYTFCRAYVTDKATLYDNTLLYRDLLAVFLGDSAGQKNGATTSFHFGKAELDKLAGENIADELFDTFAIELRTTATGLAVDYHVKTVKDSAGDCMTFTGKMTMSADKTGMDMTLDMEPYGKLKLLLNLATTATAQTPQTLPPAGAKVMDLADVYGEQAEAKTPALPAPASAA